MVNQLSWFHFLLPYYFLYWSIILAPLWIKFFSYSEFISKLSFIPLEASLLPSLLPHLPPINSPFSHVLINRIYSKFLTSDRVSPFSPSISELSSLSGPLPFHIHFISSWDFLAEYKQDVSIELLIETADKLRQTDIQNIGSSYPWTWLMLRFVFFLTYLSMNSYFCIKVETSF